jgi:hypothetical protein
MSTSHLDEQRLQRGGGTTSLVTAGLPWGLPGVGGGIVEDDWVGGLERSGDSGGHRRGLEVHCVDTSVW